jgi:hypothetical protein
MVVIMNAVYVKQARTCGAAIAFMLASGPNQSGPIYIPSLVRLPPAAIEIIARSKEECRKPLDQVGISLEEAFQFQQMRQIDFSLALKYVSLLATLNKEEWIICADTLPEQMTNPKESFSVLARIFDANSVIAISPQLMAGETSEDRVTMALNYLQAERASLQDHNLQPPPATTYQSPLMVVQYMETVKTQPYKVVASDRMMVRGGLPHTDTHPVTRTERPFIPPVPYYKRATI